MFAIYVAIEILVTCHLVSGQDEEMNGPVVPVKPDGTFYNTAELIQLWKRKGESHLVTTEDGYVLPVYRVVSTEKSAPVVLLQHGFLGTSDCWVTDPDALALKMSDAGFDVWISNVRGNVYSRNHTTMKPTDKKFWDFSWHEMGTRDLPAVIDHVLQTTGQSKLHYIGHSMGNTAAFVLLSVRPEYNQRLRSMIALAPVVFFSKLTSVLGPGGFAESIIANVMQHFKNSGRVEVFPRKDTTNSSLQITCNEAEENFRNMCLEKFERLQNSLGGEYIPAGQSLKTMDHFYQMGFYGSMRFYNMSVEENKKTYGSEEPPKYSDKFGQISAPVLLWSAKGDGLITDKDLEHLASILPNVVSDNRIKEECFNHEGFVLTRTKSCVPVRAKLYSSIIEAMKKL